jgi:hypothetical protein
MKENENIDTQSNFSDIIPDTEYDTILSNSSALFNNSFLNIFNNNNNNNNVNKINIYANEEKLLKYLNDLTEKINLNNNIFYILYITELIIQLLFINDNNNSIHGIYLILTFFINLISIKYLNNYTQFLTECFICFVIAMDILAYTNIYITIFYITENIINFIFFRYYIEVKKEYENSNIYK